MRDGIACGAGARMPEERKFGGMVEFHVRPDLGFDQSGGFNQRKVRAYNERLVLSLIRRNGALSKTDITRRSGLSAQAVSVIMRELEKDGLLLRGEPVRGRVGQPSVPMILNPEGVFSFGLKIGRRSADLMLIDFVGDCRQSISITYPYPMPEVVLAFAIHGIKDLAQNIERQHQDKIAGIGVAMPFQLWEWEDYIGAPAGTMDVWKDFDLAKELEKNTRLPAYTQNDGTAACGAELAFGRGMEFSDFVYIFVGTFVGGGIALNNSIYAGRTRNAGALGSLPIRAVGEKTGQLVDFASLFFLEKLMSEAGMDPALIQRAGYDWHEMGDVLDIWMDKAADSIALAIASATAIIDFEVAIIDGTMPPDIREALVEKVSRMVGEQAFRGLSLPPVLEGNLGSPARALGGASLPLFIRYLLDQNVLFKDA